MKKKKKNYAVGLVLMTNSSLTSTEISQILANYLTAVMGKQKKVK